MNKCSLIYLVTLMLLVLGCSPPEPQDDTGRESVSTPEQVSESFEDQVSQFIQKFPYQETYNYALGYTGGDPARLNSWLRPPEPALVKAGEDPIVRTNNDTYYNMAFVFLDDSPVFLESKTPSGDRFYSFQLMDDRNANYRNVIHPEGEYTLYFGQKPSVIRGEPIEVPSRLSVVLLRVEVRDKNDAVDVAAAKSVYGGMTLTGAKPTTYPQNPNLLTGFDEEVVAEANRRMDEAIGVVPFLETIVGPGQEPGREVSFLNHSAGTKAGWGGPDPAHSAYETIFFDSEGEELRGTNGTYSVTTEEPPVDGFWSITVYDTDRGGFLHPNEDDRYHINATIAERNSDGTVTFTFKQDCNATDLNCLEVPAGRFDLVPRYYFPKNEIISGEWTWPKISLQPN